MNQRKPKQPIQNIRIARVDLPLEFVITDVENAKQLEELREPNQPLFESDQDIFLIKPGIAYRFQKPNSRPRIVTVKKLELNPDRYSAKIELSLEELFAFARRERLFLFETQDGFYIPSEVVMYAVKEKG
jgi:hypothetical protein